MGVKKGGSQYDVSGETIHDAESDMELQVIDAEEYRYDTSHAEEGPGGTVEVWVTSGLDEW